MARRYNFLTRCLAAVALLFVYVVGASAILVGATTTPAQAWRGRGWYGRGFYGGYGWRGYPYYYAPPPVYYAPRAYYGQRCYWSRRWGRTICRW
ncbi:MAG: hypothetical protein U1E61_18380 [Bradyrhizobium sp.]